MIYKILVNSTLLLLTYRHILIEGYSIDGSLSRNQRQADEKQTFDWFVNQTQRILDDQFEKFMEDIKIEAEARAKSDGNSNAETNWTPAARELMSQNTMDKFQELLESMRKDVTDEFWLFMKKVQDEMQKSMDGLMASIEKEMNASFDEFFKWIMGRDDTPSSRTTKQNIYNDRYKQWRENQLKIAAKLFKKYEEGSLREVRNLSSALEDDRLLQDVFAREITSPYEYVAIDAGSNEVISRAESSAPSNAAAPLTNPQQLTSIVPAPFKDLAGLGSAASGNANTPTLFIGGFSMIMMPLSGAAGLTNVQQLISQAGPGAAAASGMSPISLPSLPTPSF